MNKNQHCLANRICPFHKTPLHYIGRYQLGCSGKVKIGKKQTPCPHTEYIASENPEYITLKTVITIIDRLKMNDNISGNWISE